jgi:hypothetical protein
MDFLVNRVIDPRETEAASERMTEACNRFLGRQLRCLGGVPEDPTQRSLLAHPERLTAEGQGGPAQAALREILAASLVPLLATRPLEARE